MEELTFDKYTSVIHDYLTIYCIAKNLVPDTIYGKKQLWDHATLFLNGRPFNLETITAFQTYAGKTRIEVSSKKKLEVEIKAFINYCYKQRDLFERNWSHKIIGPKKVPKKKWNLLSEENALKVIITGCVPNSFDNHRIRKAKNEHCLALQTILLNGFRVGEVIGMRGFDLVLDAQDPYVVIREPKSQEVQYGVLHPASIPILRERVTNNKVFSITEKTANKLLRRGAEKLNLVGYDNTCHRLRDIFAITRLRKGDSLQLVSRLLRHDSIKTTDDHYSHYLIGDLAPVVANSNIMQPSLTAREFLEKAKKALKIAGLIRPEQYETKIYEDRGVVKIEVVFPEHKDSDSK